MGVSKIVFNTEDGEQTLIDLTKDTVTPDTLAQGVTAHAANGEKIVGTMESGSSSAPRLTTKTLVPEATERTHTPPAGYVGFSSVTVAGDDNLIPENIVAGVEIFGVMGTAATDGEAPFPIMTVINQTDYEICVLGQYCASNSTTEISNTINMIPVIQFFLLGGFSSDLYCYELYEEGDGCLATMEMGEMNGLFVGIAEVYASTIIFSCEPDLYE